MGNRLTDLGFEEWVRHLFDHEAGPSPWYYEVDADYWDGPPRLSVAHLTRLFEDPVPHTAGFGDVQLDRGLWYLVGSGGSDCMLSLLDPGVPLEARLRGIRAFVPFFERFYAARCSPHLSHLDEPGTGPLNSSCYMWWDITPLFPRPEDPGQRETDRACLEVMERVLEIDSVACRESALHGLGHWQRAYPEVVGGILDRFLRARSGLRPELLRYAEGARTGCVL